MLIAQLSDPHVKSPGQLLYENTFSGGLDAKWRTAAC